MKQIYLDNGATSFPKAPGVGQAMKDYIEKVGVNVNRSSYRATAEAALSTLTVREDLCRLFGAGEDPSYAIFTSGVTMSLNMIMKGALHPGDHLIISGMEHNAVARPATQLEAAGVHVVVSDAQDIEGTYTAISMIGELVGRQAEAASIVESMQKTFDEIRANAGDGTKSIYFEVSPLQYGLWTAGSGTFMDEIANMLGLTNCFADVTGWGEISEEQVLERNPDYIVTISMYFGEGPTPEEEILSRTGWENVTAVKNGKILNLPNNELSRPAPRLADGAKALYDFVYGE